MKKILLSIRDFNIGGIENALISLIQYLLEKEYKITITVEKKTGNFLKDIPNDVKIIEYTPSKVKFKLIRKFINATKRLKFVIRYHNKFDTSVSFATYLKSGSFVARTASKNSILWCHADYLSLFKGDKEKVEEFFEDIRFEKFSKIVFVSKSAEQSFLEVFPKQKNTYFCNNLIDHKKIYEKTEEHIDVQYDETLITFLNVGRHDEDQKKLTRIIEATEKLKKEKYKFRVLFVGDGPDSEEYKKMVEEKKLSKYIIFLGAKENPYPYFKISNCVIISSDYEGYPLVFLESFILNKPIITTDVSDYETVQQGRGIVTRKTSEDIYSAMKRFIESGYEIKEEFNVTNYNEEIKRKLDKILRNS